MSGVVVCIILLIVIIVAGVVAWTLYTRTEQKNKAYERALKMVPMLIHLPPSTDDIQGNGRDERDVTNEAISEAQVMYSIIASTLTKGLKGKIYGQKHISFEIVSVGGLVKYYALVPAVLTETVKQAVVSAYPTARLEETDEENIFSKQGGIAGVVGGELRLKREYAYPIATYEDAKWDATAAILNAFSKVKDGEGMAVQVMFRPTDPKWSEVAKEMVQNVKDGKEGWNGSNAPMKVLNFFKDIIEAPFRVPDMHQYDEEKAKTQLTQLQQDEISAIENKMKYPAFETLIRVIASSENRPRSEALLGGLVAAFSQFDSPTLNGFQYDMLKDEKKLAKDYVFRDFPQRQRSNILNSVELASIFHLPAQNSIPTSQVERQLTKQVDGPAKLVTEGVLLGVNEFRGEQKQIRLSENDRRRHTYVIGATGMGKSVFLKNVAYQDMMDGRGFAFIDPHGDVT